MDEQPCLLWQYYFVFLCDFGNFLKSLFFYFSVVRLHNILSLLEDCVSDASSSSSESDSSPDIENEDEENEENELDADDLQELVR